MKSICFTWHLLTQKAHCSQISTWFFKLTDTSPANLDTFTYRLWSPISCCTVNLRTRWSVISCFTAHFFDQLLRDHLLNSNEISCIWGLADLRPANIRLSASLLSFWGLTHWTETSCFVLWCILGHTDLWSSNLYPIRRLNQTSSGFYLSQSPPPVPHW